MSTFICPRCGHEIQWTHITDLHAAHTQHLLEKHMQEIDVEYKEIENLIE